MSATTVHLLGGFQTDFAKPAGESGIFGLLCGAAEGALAATSVDPAEVETIHVGNLASELFTGQAHLGAMLASVDPAFHGLPTCRHEAACASGSVALLAAMADIEAGRYDVALVVGVEVMRNRPGREAGEFLGCAAWVGRELEGERFPWPAQFARIVSEYEDRWGLKHEHLAAIAETNLTNARKNPLAQKRDRDIPASYGEDDRNPVVSGRLRRTDCGPITDGAVAVVLAGPRFASAWARRTGRPIAPVISGWGHRTAPLALEDNLRAGAGSPLLFPHMQATAQDAFHRAGLADVSSVDVLEVHDCFTISEYVAIDHLGLTVPGESWKAIEDGVIDSAGILPINPGGGLLGSGHPVGATGVRMALDGWRQVTANAGDYQVDGAHRAATLNMGGSFTSVVCLVIEADG